MQLLLTFLADAAHPLDANGLPQVTAGSASLQTILSVVFGIIGALSLLVVTISGLRYVTSAGDPQKTAQAKSGIIYALVGLAVSLSAEAIVAYVIGNA